MANALLLVAALLLVVWIVLVFEMMIPVWAVYLLGIVILLLLVAWLVVIFRNGNHSGGRWRTL